MDSKGRTGSRLTRIVAIVIVLAIFQSDDLLTPFYIFVASSAAVSPVRRSNAADSSASWAWSRA